MRFVNLTGRRFSRWVVIDRSANKGRQTVWNCICDCGNTSKVTTTALLTGRSKSCGCLARDKRIAARRKHGDSHGCRLYRIWRGMIGRCFNKNRQAYLYYGGRGITVCKEWLTYTNFKAWAMSNGYDDSLSIERKDNDTGYCPSNCSWIPVTAQSKNRRVCRIITYCGETHTIADWGRILGISRYTLYTRFNNGLSVEEALKVRDI
jgi:hypothetical protein